MLLLDHGHGNNNGREIAICIQNPIAQHFPLLSKIVMDNWDGKKIILGYFDTYH
jgi:hypothetical protein